MGSGSISFEVFRGIRKSYRHGGLCMTALDLDLESPAPILSPDVPYRMLGWSCFCSLPEGWVISCWSGTCSVFYPGP